MMVLLTTTMVIVMTNVLAMIKYQFISGLTGALIPRFPVICWVTAARLMSVLVITILAELAAVAPM